MILLFYVNLLKLTPTYRSTQHNFSSNPFDVTMTLSNTSYQVWRKKYLCNKTPIWSTPFTEVKHTASCRMVAGEMYLVTFQVNYNFTKILKEPTIINGTSKIIQRSIHPTLQLDLLMNKYLDNDQTIFNTTSLYYINRFWYPQLFKYTNLNTLKLLLKHLRVTTNKNVTTHLVNRSKNTPLLLTLRFFIILLVKFTNLFNWIRFKTSTPMQSFRNALFIERDSKQRRVMSNFGLTFRNSKWVNYSQNNLNTRIFTPWKVNTPVSVFLLTTAVLLILTQILTTQGVFEYTFIGSLIDSMFESLLTSIEYFTIVFFITTSTLVNTLYYKVLTTIFNVNVEVGTGVLTNTKSLDYKFTSKDAAKLLFTAKLKNLHSNANTLESIFKTNFQDNTSLVNVSTAYQLYRIVGGCVNNPTSIQSLDYNQTRTIDHQNTLLANQWSLSKLNNESMHRSINTNSGLYTMNNYSFRQLTKLSTSQPELKNLSTLYSNYINIARTDRWLYRYSMLHRKSLHKAHTLTLAKRLTSAGFFNSSLTSSNLWASRFIQSTSNLQTTLSHLYTSLYGNVWQEDTTSNVNPLTSLEFFETSYFWVLKRFYLTNNLTTHKTTSDLQLKSSVDLTHFNNNIKTQHEQTELLRFNLEDKAIFITSLYDNQEGQLTWRPEVSNNCTQDVTTNYFESSVIENDNLDILAWVYDDKLSNNGTFNFFNYNNYQNQYPTTFKYTLLRNSPLDKPTTSPLQTYLNF